MLETKLRSASATPDRKLPEAIAEVIREAIATGEIKPGERLLSESELVELAEVSRATAREALRMLEREGLITIQIGRTGGVFARKPDDASVARPLSTLLRFDGTNMASVMEARAILEESAAALAAERVQPRDIDELEAILEAERAASGEEATRLGLLFHKRLVQASGNRTLTVFFASLTQIIEDWTRNSVLVDQERGHSRRAHERIIEALRARKPDDARRRIRRHLAAYKELSETNALVAPLTRSGRRQEAEDEDEAA